MDQLTKAVHELREGNQDAFQTVYTLTRRTALAVVRRYCDVEADYEDIIQDTYIRVYQSIGDLKEEEKAQAWINRIAANTAIRHNQKKRPTMFSEMENEEGQLPDFEDERQDYNPEKIADRKAVSEIVREILDSLPEDQRAALWMVYGQKVTIREMAESLGISENTIKSRLYQGRQKLMARKADFRKLGIEITAIPVAVLVAMSFEDTVYAAETAAALGAGSAAAAVGENAAASSVAGSAGAGAGASSVAGSAGVSTGVSSVAGGAVGSSALGGAVAASSATGGAIAGSAAGAAGVAGAATAAGAGAAAAVGLSVAAKVGIAIVAAGVVTAGGVAVHSSVVADSERAESVRMEQEAAGENEAAYDMDAGAILDEIEVRISALDPENPASLEELQEFVQSDALDADAIFTAMDTDVIWIPSDTGSDLTGIYANGGIYTGDAESGIRTGNGAWYYKMDEDDAYYYNGEWANDMPNGYGSFGERFEGNFVDGVGNGTMYRISSDGENKWEFTVTDGVPDRVEIPEEYLEDWHYERLSRYTDTVKPEIIPYYVEYRDRGETQSIRRLLCWDGGLDQPFAVGGIGLDEFIRSCQTELPEDEIILAKMREQLSNYFLVDASWDWWRWFDNPEVRDRLRKFVKEEFDMETYQRITGSDVVWYPSDTGDERYALYPNGGIYWGSAENGIRVSDGFGNWWYDDEDGAISYDSDWQNDLPNGSGSIIFGNDHGWTDYDYEYEENVSEPAYGNFVNGVGTVDIGGTMQEVVVRGVDGGTHIAEASLEEEEPVTLLFDSFGGDEIATLFKEKVEEASAGRITVELSEGSYFPNDEGAVYDLGSDYNQPVDLKFLSINALIDYGGCTGFEKLYEPYTFTGHEDFCNWALSKEGEKLLTETVEKGLKTVGIFWCESSIGFNQLFLKDKVSSAEGLTIAGGVYDCHAEYVTSLGAEYKYMIFPEIREAFEDGSIDGYEDCLYIYETISSWDYAPYICMDYHICHPQILLMKESTYHSLSSRQQEILKKAGEETLKEYSAILEKRDEEMLQEFIAQGAEVITLDGLRH